MEIVGGSAPDDPIGATAFLSSRPIPTKFLGNYGVSFAFYFDDPDGNMIEVYWPTGERSRPAQGRPEGHGCRTGGPGAVSKGKAHHKRHPCQGRAHRVENPSITLEPVLGRAAHTIAESPVRASIPWMCRI